ncbi:hypothetical protein EUTSA_v10012313mg, partial [Eutrema salsugineum]
IKGKIEACIQKYMSMEQTMTYLHENHQIYPPLVTAIWERLQRDNPDFFKEYNKRCEVARQIATFNDLLAQQVYLMQKFREIELSTTAPVTQLQKPNCQLHHHDQLNHHHQDQIHDQWIAQLQKPNRQLHHHDQLNHHHDQDQMHDQWIESTDYTYTEKLISPLIDPSLIAAPPQSEPYAYSFGYCNDFEGLSFENFARDLDQQPQNLLMERQELYYPQEDQFATFLLPKQLPEYETWNNLDF